MGKILRVNLSEGTLREERLEEAVARKFIGGRGLGARILFDELEPGIDPLGPKNKIVFATGPITGTPIIGNSKYVVMAKSPLTGIWGEAHAAGYFGPEMKYAGYDAIIVEGAAEKPVYLWIHDGEAYIKDAGHLWGKFTGDTLEIVRKEVKEEEARVASIGPGAEKLVRFGNIIADGHYAAGRTGMGAVMASKKLKAIAVRGAQRVEIAKEKEFKDLAKEAVKEAFTPQAPGKLFGWTDIFGPAKEGTSADLEPVNASGRLPTKNFRKCVFENAEKIGGEAMARTIRVRRDTCPACPMACNQVVEAKEPYVVDPTYGGPEYETIGALGSLCMNDNLVAIAKGNELCNKYSIDTISTGASIAFAMECYEKGLLTKEDTGGIDLTWGNHKAIIQMIHKIANREDIGDLLAEGVKRAAERMGRGAEKFAMHVKGMEVPLHEPRGKKGLAISYAVANRGCCHLQGVHDDYFIVKNAAPEAGLIEALPDVLSTDRSKVKYVKMGEDFLALQDCALVCMHIYWPASYIPSRILLEAFKVVTGWDTSPSELMLAGERVFNLCRAFNVREGITRKDDVLPERLMEPLPEGPYEGEAISKDVLDGMLDVYYELRGWDRKSGIPTKNKLEELGLRHVAEELKKLGRL